MINITINITEGDGFICDKEEVQVEIVPRIGETIKRYNTVHKVISVEHDVLKGTIAVGVRTGNQISEYTSR